MGIVCVICTNVLYGTNYNQWTWVNCARVITKITTNLLYHLENKHAGVASVKALVSNNKNKSLVVSVPETEHSIGSIPNTRVPLYISVTMKKFSDELVKRDMFC